MKSTGSIWRVWAAVIAAFFLFALAASTPAWVARVPGAKLTSVDPQVVVGLVSVILAVLTLVGVAVFYLLKLEVERSITQRVEREVVIPLDIAHFTLASFAFYLDYSTMWRARNYSGGMATDNGFRWSVFQAVDLARTAHEKAHSLSDGGKYELLDLDSASALAYHLAIKYMLERDERDREEAFTLLKEVEPSSSRDREFQETITWVKMLCSQWGTQEYQEGLTALSRVLNDKNIPLQWRLLQHEKYTKLFNASLPTPT